MLAAALHIQKHARRHLANQIANAERDFTFQAQHSYVAWHFMRRKFIAGEQYEPNHFKIIGFDNRVRNRRCNCGVKGRTSTTSPDAAWAIAINLTS